MTHEEWMLEVEEGYQQLRKNTTSKNIPMAFVGAYWGYVPPGQQLIVGEPLPEGAFQFSDDILMKRIGCSHKDAMELIAEIYQQCRSWAGMLQMAVYEHPHTRQDNIRAKLGHLQNVVDDLKQHKTPQQYVEMNIAGCKAISALVGLGGIPQDEFSGQEFRFEDLDSGQEFRFEDLDSGQEFWFEDFDNHRFTQRGPTPPL